MTVHAYSGYRFPADMIQRAIWMYLRFTFSYRDVEELLAARQRGILRDCSTGTVKLLMEGALSLAQVWILGGSLRCWSSRPRPERREFGPCDGRRRRWVQNGGTGLLPNDGLRESAVAAQLI